MQNVVRYYLAIIALIFIHSAFAIEQLEFESKYDDSMLREQSEKNPITLSLEEAIYLAVRENPNIQTSKLEYVLQKFNYWVQEWQFLPHYSLQASATYSRNGSPGQPIQGSHSYSVQPAITVLTPIGTNVTLTSTNNDTGHFNPSLSAQIIQPLMRGFGTAVVEAALNSAKDSDVISKLNIDGVLRSTVSNVINAYLDVVAAEKNVVINDDAVKRAEQSVTQTKLYIQAGHKAGNELITVQADVARAQTQLESAKNNLLQARFALLTAIGINPNTNIKFTTLDIDHLINKYPSHEINQVKSLVLKNDIKYQTAQITLFGQTSRNLLIAVDNTRWQLNLTANASTGGGSGGGQSAGVDSLFNGANQGQSVGLALTIPIDDQIAKQQVVNAKVALREAELALKQEKWSLETSAINGWNSVISAERGLRFAVDSEQLQYKTYNISYQKYLHGLIDSLALQQAQLQLIQAQQTKLSSQIDYLKALVRLDELIGNTLKTWDINVRYK